MTSQIRKGAFSTCVGHAQCMGGGLSMDLAETGTA